MKVNSFLIRHQSFLMLVPNKLEIKSMGSGKMMVEFFSAEMELRVWGRMKRDTQFFKSYWVKARARC